MAGYTTKTDPDLTARAIGRDMKVSPKKTREIATAIRGMRAERAVAYLVRVEALKQAVPYGRFNKRVAHQKGIGPGGFPQKPARHVRRLLEEAIANATYKGLETDDLIIHTISASLGRTIPGRMPRAHGRATPWNEQTTNVEIILALPEDQ